jgi:hypothetical protein
MWGRLANLASAVAGSVSSLQACKAVMLLIFLWLKLASIYLKDVVSSFAVVVLIFYDYFVFAKSYPVSRELIMHSLKFLSLPAF